MQMDETIEATLGGGEGEAGFFKEDKNAFVIIFRIKNPSSDNAQDSFERTLFISGITYEVTEQDYDKVYVLFCKSVKQIENIIPAMEMVHSKRDVKSKIKISNEIKEFFAKNESEEESTL